MNAVDGEASGPMAEFVALREEILHWSQHIHGIFVFQVGASGAVLSFALSQPGREPVALAVPIVSYLLCTRYYYALLTAVNIGMYIRTVLSPKVSGGLGWEEWNRSIQVDLRPRLYATLVLTFPGTAFVAFVVGTIGLAFGDLALSLRLGFSALWCAALVFLLLNIRLVVQMRNYRAKLP